MILGIVLSLKQEKIWNLLRLIEDKEYENKEQEFREFIGKDVSILRRVWVNGEKK